MKNIASCLMASVFVLLFACTSPAKEAVKVYISVDMEGIGGVTSQPDVLPLPNDPDYQMFRHIMTQEANAAIRGAYEGGATYVLVEEHHGAYGFRNIIISELDPRAELIRGWPRPHGAITGLDPTFKAAMFIGYHAREGTPRAVLSHSFLWDAVVDFRVNGRSVGEGGFNAAVAGAMGVPVVLVSGDDVVNQQMNQYLGNVQQAVVKQALGRYSAVVLPPQRAQEIIQTAARTAMQHLAEFHPLRISTPYHLEVRYKPAWDAHIEEIAKAHSEIARSAPRTLACTAGDVQKLIGCYMTLLDIGVDSPPQLGIPKDFTPKQ